MNCPATSFVADPNISPSPSPVLIGVIVTFFVVSLLFGIGLFIWRRKKRQAISLSSSASSVRSSFGSDGWTHARDDTAVALPASGASMGLGGLPPEMKQRKDIERADP